MIRPLSPKVIILLLARLPWVLSWPPTATTWARPSRLRPLTAVHIHYHGPKHPVHGFLGMRGQAGQRCRRHKGGVIIKGGPPRDPLSSPPGTRRKQTFAFSCVLWTACPWYPSITRPPATASPRRHRHRSQEVLGRRCRSSHRHRLSCAPGPRPPLPGPRGKPGDGDSFPPGIYAWSGPEPQKLLIPDLLERDPGRFSPGGHGPGEIFYAKKHTAIGG